MILTERIEIHTEGENDIVDVTGKVEEVIRKLKVKDGAAIIFVQSATSGITIMEFEDGLLVDLPRAMERIAPKSAEYEHEKAWHDGNGHSHVRSSVVGTSLTVPVLDGRLALGRWQQIVLTEFDTRPRKRSIIVQVLS